MPAFQPAASAPTTLAAYVHRLTPSRPAWRRGITRERRWSFRPRLDGRAHVNAFNADLVNDWSLSDGARATGVLILQLAGGPGRMLRTFTKSLATRRGLTTRTIRNHYRELEAAGWLVRWHNLATNEVLLILSGRLHPRAGAAAVPEDRKRQLPQPWARPRQGQAAGGRKAAAAINPTNSNSKTGYRGEAAMIQPPALTREEQLAYLAKWAAEAAGNEPRNDPAAKESG